MMKEWGIVKKQLCTRKSIVDLMIQKGIGVERVPLYMHYEHLADFIEEE